jgi:hypothetical protein
MNEERDRFLTEYMGWCWHDYDPDKPLNTYSLEAYVCKKCKGFILGNNDFSVEEDFGRLFVWAEEQDYLTELVRSFEGRDFADSSQGSLYRNEFADALYEFLKNRNT